MTEPTLPKTESINLGRLTLVAFLLALLVLVVAVLPAEYGIDPLGAGKALGFGRLYQPQDNTATIPASDALASASYPALTLEKAGSGPDVPRPTEANNPPPAQQLALREDTVRVVVPAGKGIEFKVNMRKYGTLKYEWITDQGLAYFDFHGEVKQAKPGPDVFFESYTIARATNMVGTFLAPFEGRHGWYFKNTAPTQMVVKLRLQGQYQL